MSAKAVAEKLLVKPGTTVWLSSPSGLELIRPLPPEARAVAAIDEAGVAVLFAGSVAGLERLLGQNGDRLDKPGILWIAYPKGGKSDLKRDTIPPQLARRNMRPVGQVAIDDVWSALRFRSLEPGEPPFMGGGR